MYRNIIARFLNLKSKLRTLSPGLCAPWKAFWEIPIKEIRKKTIHHGLDNGLNISVPTILGNLGLKTGGIRDLGAICTIHDIWGKTSGSTVVSLENFS